MHVGNGRLGAMIFGGVSEAQIQISYETLWTGEPHDYSYKDAVKCLDQLRQLFFEGTAKKAHIFLKTILNESESF